MRSLTLALLLAAALLAGCAQHAPPAGDGDGSAASAPEAGAGAIVEAGGLPRLRFAAPEFNQTATYDGEFQNPDPCFGIACTPLTLSYDLGALVPADAPVELAVTLTTDACARPYLSVTETSIFRYAAGSETLSATVVRAPSGTVTLVVDNCATLSGTEGSNPVSAEVRSVVRADVLPPFMPVLVALAPGDRIEAMGDGADGIDDLVVVPPGRDPVHATAGAAFNVTADLPAGQYVVMAKGGDAMLHGPANATLRPARLQMAVGEDRPIQSGQPLAWTASVPGTPAFATLYLLTGTAGGVDNARVSYNSGYTLAIRQGGADLATGLQDSCIAPCSLNGPGGQFTDFAATGLFPEGLGLGELEFEVTNDTSQGLHAYEVVGYIVA